MNIQDRKKSLTAEDIRRRYNLDDLDKDRKSIQMVKNTLNKVEIEFQNFIDIIKKDLNEYPSQVEITTWFFDGIPTDEHPEFDDSSEHLGDLYYDRQSGKAYKYIYDNDEYVWEETTDKDTIKSLAIESSKADTSDNKRVVFNGIPVTPYAIGDVWINNGTYYRCRSARESGIYSTVDWIIYTDYTEDMVLLDTRAVIDQFKTIVTQDYVSKVQLETNTQGIYANVSETYSTKTEVSTIDGKATQAKETADTTATNLSIEAGKISIINQQIGDRTGKTQTITAEINEIKASISDVADLTKSETTITGHISDTSFQNINASVPISIEIRPIEDNISYLYPCSTLYPSSTLYLKTRTIRFINTSTNEIFDYILPDDLLYYDADTYDVFIADYENRVCKVIKKCKYNADGSVSTLATPIENTYDFSDIESALNLTDGNYEVSLLGYTSGYIFVRLMSQNIYTTQFATKVELAAEMSLTKEDYTVKLSRKVGDDEVISKINLTSEAATIDASKVNITGVITAINNNTTTTIDGNKITTGTITANQLSSNSVNADKIVANSITAGKIADATITGSKIANGTITGAKISNSTIANANIQDGTIENAKIKNATITGAKISAGTITGDKIAANTITASKVASDIITTTNFSAQSINANQITTGTISTSRLSSDVITTTNFSAQNINASQITSGTINADRIAANTITSSKLNISTLSSVSSNLGTITGGSITIGSVFNLNSNGHFKYYNGVGYLSCGQASGTSHPWLSAVNVNRNNGISFRTGTTYTNAGDSVGEITMANNWFYFSKGAYFNGNINSLNGNFTGPSGASTGESGGAYFHCYNAINLYPISGSYAYVGSATTANRIATSSSGPSSKNVKCNLINIEEEYDSLYDELKKVNMYTFDYKYKGIRDDNKDFGFIIDELEDTKYISQYIRNYKRKGLIKDNKLITLLDVESEEYKNADFTYKEWERDSYIKLSLILIKALQSKIDLLEEKVGELNG